jgi:hypothetical protein
MHRLLLAHVLAIGVGSGVVRGRDRAGAQPIACGLTAIASNAVCVVPVLLRVRAAEDARPYDVVRYSRMIDWTAVVGIPAALVAFGIGASGLA